MKKLILIFAVSFLAGNSLMAQVDSTTTTTTTTKTTSTKYLYYPDANVYYNESTKAYMYLDPSTNTWTTNAQLPTTIVIDRKNSNEIAYNGTDIWKDNAMHQKKYRKAMKKLSKAD